MTARLLAFLLALPLAGCPADPPDDGVVEDQGLAWSGSGMEYITGAVGIQP